jgi:hypothetical protein
MVRARWPTLQRWKFTSLVRCTRDGFVSWGFSPEGLRRLGRVAGLGEVEIVEELMIDRHPRILALLRAAG